MPRSRPWRTAARSKQLVGMIVRGRGIARHGYPMSHARRRGEQRRRDQRRAVADARRANRDGLPATGRHRRSVPWSTSPSAIPESMQKSSRYPSTSAPLPERREENAACRCPRTFATRPTTSGCASRATKRWSASPSTPRPSSATSSSWSFRRPGCALESAQSFGVIESVKTASDLYCPVAGEVIAINTQLADKPELVNEDPFGEGWMIRLRLSDPDSVAAAERAAHGRGRLPITDRGRLRPADDADPGSTDRVTYGPHTPADRQQMLAALGIDSVDALFSDIPAASARRRPGPAAARQMSCRSRAGWRHWRRATAWAWPASSAPARIATTFRRPSTRS